MESSLPIYPDRYLHTLECWLSGTLSTYLNSAFQHHRTHPLLLKVFSHCVTWSFGTAFTLNYCCILSLWRTSFSFSWQHLHVATPCPCLSLLILWKTHGQVYIGYTNYHLLCIISSENVYTVYVKNSIFISFHHLHIVISP